MTNLHTTDTDLGPAEIDRLLVTSGGEAAALADLQDALDRLVAARDATSRLARLDTATLMAATPGVDRGRSGDSTDDREAA